MRIVFPLFLCGLLSGFPLKAQSLFELASKYHREGKDSVTLEILTTLHRAHPQDSLGAKALLFRSEIYLGMGDTTKALSDLKALSGSPYPGISFRALETLMKIKPRGKDYAEIIYRLSINNENREERLKGLQVALEGFKENRDYKNALDVTRWLVVELPGKRESLQVVLGDLLLKTGNKNEARLIFSRYPDDENALLGLTRRVGRDRSVAVPAGDRGLARARGSLGRHGSGGPCLAAPPLVLACVPHERIEEGL